jgi:alpha-1,2-mannosyltransferase
MGVKSFLAHPPLLSLAKGIGTAAGLAVARVLTACAGAANVALLGRLVRHRGPLAAALACGVLAVYPDDIAAAHTLLLEPWLNLFCLIGAVAVFDGDGPASRRRLIRGGIAFGTAGAIKVWAIVPVVIILLLCARRPRRAAAFGTGVAAGFLATAIPFALAAPGAFFESVVVAQLSRTDASRVPIWSRLVSLAGLDNVSGLDPADVYSVAPIVAAFIVGGFALTRLVRRQPVRALEWYTLAGTAAVVLMFCWPPDFYYHYTAFLVPFLGLALALAVERLAGLPWVRWSAAVLVLAAITVTGVTEFQAEASSGPVHVPQAAVYQAIAPGSCVLTDQVSLTIAADRFVSDVPGCSLMVDAIGTDYALSDGRNALTGAGLVPAVRAAWAAAFAHAQFVWLSGLNGRRIPWTPALKAYFQADFRPVIRASAPPPRPIWTRRWTCAGRTATRSRCRSTSPRSRPD